MSSGEIELILVTVGTPDNACAYPFLKLLNN